MTQPLVLRATFRLLPLLLAGAGIATSSATGAPAPDNSAAITEAIASSPAGSNVIEAIDTRSGNADAALEFRIHLAQPLAAAPTHFATGNPARIVVDLPATRNGTGSKHASFNFQSGTAAAILRSYVIAQNTERCRIVINLAEMIPYTVHTDRGMVSIRIKPELMQTAAIQASAKIRPAASKVQRATAGQIDSDEPPGTGNHDNISLNFQNIEVRALLQIFADFTGINMIASDSVTGTLSLRLKDIPWPQALDIVLQARDLEMRRHGPALWIAPRAELLAKEKNELEQRTQISALEPLQTEVFQLNYQKAETFRKLFSVRSSTDGEAQPNLLSRRGSTLVDQRTNQLFVTDTPQILGKVRKLLAQIDIPARQVQIEARIVEADDAFSRNLGVRLGFSAGSQRLAARNNYPGTVNPAVNLPAAAIGASSAASIAFSLFGASADHFLNLELSALEADGKGQIISSPRVVTADQQPALIEQGEEIPYQQETSNGGTSTSFKKANLKLEVTPQITPDGNVILAVDISKDSRGMATPGGLAINTKHVKTLVQVENGGTVVIGGIYTQTASDRMTKVPLLGDLPVFGYLFKNTEKVTNKTELLIFLTPKIIADGNIAPDFAQ